jgi:LemA protein
MKSNTKLFLIIAVIIVCVIGFMFLTIQNTNNGAINMEENVKTANSDIKVQEKRRVDLIYNLVDCVKSYNEHEYNTLKDVVDARSSNATDATIQEVTTMISAVAENYPTLKANDNYKQLMTELATTENLIAQHRSNYNQQIKQYNRYVRKFPNRLFLSWCGYEAIEFNYLDYNAPADAPQNLFD